MVARTDPNKKLPGPDVAGWYDEYHVRLLEVYRETLEKYGHAPPPGYGPAGPGQAVFSVSSFMDTLPPIEENADELMQATPA
mgnify:CR=1 FL=1